MTEIVKDNDIKTHWFWNSIHKHRKIYYQVLFASLFINILALASAFYIMTVYDRVVPNGAISSLIALTLGMAIVVVFDFITKMLRGYFVDVAGGLLDDNIARRLFNKFVSHDAIKLGNSPSKIQNTIKEFDMFRDFFSSATMVTLIDIPFMLIFLIFLWSIGGLVALVPTLIIPCVLIVSGLVHPFLKNYSEKNLNASHGKMSVLHELLNNMETVKTVAGGDYLQNKWTNSVENQNRISIISKTIANIAVTFSGTGTQLSQTLMIFFGVFLIVDGNLSMGALIACVILSGRCLAPLGQAGQLIARYAQAMTAYRKIDAIMIEDSRDEKFLSYKHGGSIKDGSIEVKNLSWGIGDTTILNDISFQIKKGEKIAILGNLGGGKSTLLKCLVGFNPLSKGSIKIGNFDINSISPSVLRDNIGYCPQTVQLFSGTIYDNIAIGLDNPSQEQVEKAAEISGVDRFIGSLEGGYDYILHEGGRNLSGGQRKSIALARAVIKKPKILLLDEPTTSLDGQAIEYFLDQLDKNFIDSTVIIATHNNSDLRIVNKVMIMVQGKIAAFGPKEEILKKGPVE
ncbi:ATP-binding cassette domain-containing protein [Hyphomicrobiales bacterium]|nr:ATP-binding cassette domain-containing protein [Hyphomicrobiales bacterium]